MKCKSCKATLSREDDDHICDANYHKTIAERDAYKAKCDAMDAILSGDNVEIQFDRGKFRISYHNYGDVKGMWCAFDRRDGKFIGDPQRFYPLPELLKMIEAFAALDTQEKSDD